MKKKIQRNDPCVCGSGKKFKKCCESRSIGGRYLATRLDAAKTASLTSFFQGRAAVLRPSSAAEPEGEKGLSFTARVQPASSGA